MAICCLCGNLRPIKAYRDSEAMCRQCVASADWRSSEWAEVNEPGKIREYVSMIDVVVVN